MLITRMTSTTWRAAARSFDIHPASVFAGFCLLHLVVWTVLPAVLYLNLPLDLIEALTYGREWQIGYDKLPPLPWWTVEAVYRLIGRDWAYYALAQVAVLAAFLCVWIMARPIVGTQGALAAILILDGLHYFNYTAAKFNHDVLELPFWALAGFAFRRALRGGGITFWLLLGFAMGGAFWAKYFVVVLALPLVAFMLFDATARRHFRTAGPYVAAAVTAVMILPHLIWLVQHDFPPLRYVEYRAARSHGFFDHVLFPLTMAIDQFGFLLPLLLIALPLFVPDALLWPRIEPTDRAPATTSADPFDRRLVTWLAFGPVITLALMSAISGRGTVPMWGYPLWLFLGVWLVMVARSFNAQRLARISALWAFVFTGMAVAFIVNYAVLPSIDRRYRAVLEPGKQIALELQQRWREATGTPLTYVIGDMWTGGNIGHYAPDHPRVLIEGNPARAPWIDVNDLKRKGALVVWYGHDLTHVPEYYTAIAGAAEVQPPLHVPFKRSPLTQNIGWAILRPQP